MSLKENLAKIYDRFSERMKSPFILTFTIVWIIHNWSLIYRVVNFGDSFPLEAKTMVIREYIRVYGFGGLFVDPLLWALASFGLYLFVSLIYELIFELYSRWARPFIFHLANKNKITSSDLLEQTELKNQKLRESNALLKGQFEAVEEKYEEIMGQLTLQKDEVIQLNTIIKSKETQVQEHLKLVQELQNKTVRYESLIRDERNFVHNSTRGAIFKLFAMAPHLPNITDSLKKANVSQLFFGSWKRSKHDGWDPLTETFSTNIKFEGNVLMMGTKFFAEIERFNSTPVPGLFFVGFKVGESLLGNELLMKVTDTLVIGVEMGPEGISKDVIQYEKI